MRYATCWNLNSFLAQISDTEHWWGQIRSSVYIYQSLSAQTINIWQMSWWKEDMLAGEKVLFTEQSSTYSPHLLLVEGNIFTEVIHYTWDFLFFLIWCYFGSRPLPGSGKRRCPVLWWMVTEVLRLWSTARQPSWNKPPASPVPQTDKGYGAMFSDIWCNTTSRR